jgi:hypothetical protein
MTTRAPVVLAAALALALLGQGVRAWHRIEASALVRAVQVQMSALGGVRAPSGLLRVSELALRRAQRLDPTAVEPLAFEGDLLLLSGRLADADRAYERAAGHELRPEVLFHWGLSLWRQGRVDEAVVQMRRGQALAAMRLSHDLPDGAGPLVEAAPLLPIPPLVPPRAEAPRP